MDGAVTSCFGVYLIQTADMRLFGLFLLALVLSPLRAEEDPKVQREKIWNEQIGPIMKESCVECHGEKRMKARIRVDTFDMTVKGGRRPGVVWGHPEASRIYRVITRPHGTEGAMPPGKRDPLTEDQITKIRDWIMTGPADEVPSSLPSRSETTNPDSK
ncbi:MAG: hypothetical protein EBS59_06265 [Verrucomicrobia bacterium]|jgi:mono/diheme cytochrome c family protein|nr:hypothetical protein [Verrucomicrobiota bacterium]